ncbi:DUF2243 domain-containing protein [Pueribacillus sp. YX66]|uniref:DUF2243 domain-containing protein n=1 Tax=Pueribacillus sp. YX66 TaxID=3229242 RepID=UPI00358D0D02
MQKKVLGPLLFGIGIIGMLDGIIFHQLLQWHSIYMYTDRFHQVMSDGWFHGFVTMVIFIAGILMWKTDPHEVKQTYFWGSFILGAGLFNFVEGIINHHILQIHHVKPGRYQLLADILFDAVGLLLIIIGWLMLRRSKQQKN